MNFLYKENFDNQDNLDNTTKNREFLFEMSKIKTSLSNMLHESKNYLKRKVVRLHNQKIVNYIFN